MATCLLCADTKIVDGKYCYQHHVASKKAEWLDNTDIDNLGIVKWVNEMMPEFATEKTPHFHKQLFYDLLKLYDPLYKNKYERLYELISFRESAKSTAANTLFLSYILAHNGEAFKITVDGAVREFTIHEYAVAIVSETAESAEEFTVRIRDAFTESERLRYYYRFTIQDALDSDTGQWTRSSFRMNGVYVIRVGAGQQIRGKVKGVSRLTMIIADDIYSEKNVITEESRTKIRKWWNRAVEKSVDMLKGKFIVLGTILHDDTVIVDLENNPLWKVTKVPVMGHVESGQVIMDSFHDFVNHHTKTDWETSQCILPYDEIEDRDNRARAQKAYFAAVQQEKDWELAWPERIGLYEIALMYQQAVYNNEVQGIYQEYFHQVIPPQQKRFTKDMFMRAPEYELKYEYGHTWIKLPDKEDWILCNIEFGVDIAGTGQDEAVISPVIALADMRVIVAPQVVGKWSIRDDLKGTDQISRLNRVALNPEIIGRRGLVDECFRLALRYHPSVIKVGTAGEEELIVREMRRVFQENRLYTAYIQSRPQTSREGRKEQRIFGTLLPYYETRMVYHVTNLAKLEYQLEYLGKTKNDDCADALECSFFNLQFPSNLNLNYFVDRDKETYVYSPHGKRPNKEYNVYNNWREYF